MKTFYKRFVHRNIFYHPHILVKPKQFIQRTLRFWDRSESRFLVKDQVKILESVQGYAIHVDIYQTQKHNRDIIVLIHGHFSDKTEFQGLIPKLQNRGYDVAVYNVYGEWKPFSFPLYTYGKKEKDDLHAIIQTLDQYERIHLVGHSLGAAIVAEYTHHYSDPKVCTMTMVALYESLEKAIDIGITSAAVPFFTLKVDPSEHLEHFSRAQNIELYTQNMKEILADVEENHLLVFGENDIRAPYFETQLPTTIVPKGTHTNFFTTKKEHFAQMLNDHIEKHR